MEEGHQSNPCTAEGLGFTITVFWFRVLSASAPWFAPPIFRYLQIAARRNTLALRADKRYHENSRLPPPLPLQATIANTVDTAPSQYETPFPKISGPEGGGRGGLTDISVAKTRKVQLQGGPGKAGLGHHLLEVLPPRLTVASDPSCSNPSRRQRTMKLRWFQAAQSDTAQRATVC